MAWLKRNLLFTIIMVLLVAVLAVEIFFVLGRRQTAQQAETEFQKRVEEHQNLVQKQVLPHENNVALTQAEIERQREELLLYNQAMRGSEELHEQFQAHPTTRADAFFDIASFVEEYRRRAEAANISIPENEHFGFAAYSTAGPEERQLANVYKQRVITAHILDQLFAAGPQALLGVQRPGGGEAAASEDRMMGRGGQQQSAGAPAQFRIDPQFSAAIPDVAQALPFQITFTGRSETLRDFLNSMTSFEMPLLVRSVEVVPEGEAAQAQQQSGRRRGNRQPQPQEGAEGGEPVQQEAVPLVRDNVSRFTVALEFVDVTPVEEGS